MIGVAFCGCRKPRPFTMTYESDDGRDAIEESELCERCGGVIRDWHPVQQATQPTTEVDG